MARKTDVRYVQVYTDGSAARRLEPELPSRNIPNRVRHKRRKKQVLRIDPLAWCAVAVAAVMLVLMVAGCFRLHAAKSATAQMADYVQQLSRQNDALEQEYRAGYDLADIQQKAEALGMIPAEEAQQLTITVELP